MAAATTGTGAGTGAPGGVSIRLILVLVVATALGPMAMQIVVPALPAIQEAFDVTPATAQLTLSLSAFSIALATLAYGPLSDRYGRRPALLGGLLVYLAGSALCGLATSMGGLIAGRIVQAAGGCAGIVLTRAIVRDLYDLERSAQMLAYVTMAMVAAPMLAPAVGGVLTDLAGWRSVFVLGGVLGVAVAAVVAAELPETSPAAGGAARGGGGHTMLRLLQSRPFWGYSLHVAFSIGLFYAFLSAAPFLMVRVMGRPASEYGLLFALVPGAFMLGNLAAARLSARVGVDRMIAIGGAGALAATVLLLALVLAGVWTPLALFLPTSLGGFAQGLTMSNAQAAVVSVDPRAAGAASGLSGFLQMGFAGVIAQVVGSMDNSTPYPMAIGMVACAAAALLAGLAARGRPGAADG
jgi:DHA1 family bicyclomycin/chloramphenicol resistance-like MFS transporter